MLLTGSIDKTAKLWNLKDSNFIEVNSFNCIEPIGKVNFMPVNSKYFGVSSLNKDNRIIFYNIAQELYPNHYYNNSSTHHF